MVYRVNNNKDCAGVILYCAEQATKVALDGIQILGGNGYINDYPTGRFLRDAKLYEIGAGTTEVRKLVIGRALNNEYKQIKSIKILKTGFKERINENILTIRYYI